MCALCGFREVTTQAYMLLTSGAASRFIIIGDTPAYDKTTGDTPAYDKTTGDTPAYDKTTGWQFQVDLLL